MGDYERVLLVKPKIFVYRIPPLTSTSRGFKASDWNLENPDWKGRMRLVSIADKIFLRIEDETTGQLYAQAPILKYPGPSVQPVSDSSRYFVVKVQSDTGRTALLGIGFTDRSDSFDLNVALHDHFKTLEHEARDAEPVEENLPKLDLSLKGLIRVNLNISKKDGTNSKVGSSTSTNTSNERNTQDINDNNNTKNPNQLVFLPPPPGSKPRKLPLAE